MRNYIQFLLLILVGVTGVLTEATAQYIPIGTQSSGANVSSTTVIRKEGVTENAPLTSLSADDVTQVVNYSDGLGRTFQSIGVGQSPTGGDVVMPVVHSRNGMIDTTYLPYASGSANGTLRANALRGTPASPSTYTSSEQYLFYQSTPKVKIDNRPFAQTIYRNTPDAAVIEQGAPGADWQLGNNHTVKHAMALNNSTTYRVRYWKTDGTTTANYPDNSVAVSISTDENGNLVRIYTNALGQSVLKQVQEGASNFLETYYVYDEFGRLKFQLPPKAMTTLGSGSSLDANHSSVAELIFKYTYDSRNRIAIKKTPGAAEEHIVYDKHDRIVLTQDGNLRALGKWMFVKYDRFNRPVYNGIFTDGSARATLQSTFDLLDYNTAPYFETEQFNASFQGYSNTVYPSANLTLLGVNYYDHYNFDRTGGADYNYDNTHFSGQETSANTNTRGRAVGNKSATIDANGNVTGNWLVSVVFFDKNDRPIQTQSNNHLYLTVADKSTIIYDFVKPVRSKVSHYSSSTDVVITTTRNVYDAKDRLLAIYHSVNGATEKAVVGYSYNALGQVVEKNLHCLNCASDYDHQVGQAGSVYGDVIERSTYNTNESLLIAKTSIRLTPGYTASSLVARIGLSKADYRTQLANATFMQSIDYRYNIKGWLESINNAQLNVNVLNNDDTNDYFGMEVSYNQAAGIINTPSYNGNISALRWKSVGGGAGQADQRSYKFEYDKSDRLTGATFQAHNGSSWSREANTLNESIGYDANGNILSLARNYNVRGLGVVNNLPAVTSSAQTMDNLSYTYANINSGSQNSNTMVKVEDGGIAAGFNNGEVNGTDEYQYNSDGSLIKDKNKGINTIDYNILGKPRLITFTDGRTIGYTYSANGSKLKMSVTGSNALVTDYVGGFVYENASLSFFASPEGRVVKNGNNFEYQYAITDHLGNTRILFSSVAAPAEAVAVNFESGTNTSVENYPTGAANSPMPLYNRTPGGTHSLLLNGGNNSRVGIGKAYQVYPGDKLKIEAYAKYLTTGGTSGGLTAFSAALLSAFSLPTPGAGEAGTPSSGLDSYGDLIAAGNGPGSSSFPKAFVNILVFDKDFKFVDIAFEQINGGEQPASGTPNVAHDQMLREYVVQEAGYAFVYVSNESATEAQVYFDDVTFTYTPSNIIQGNEYYPFGLQAANSWTRIGAKGNNFLANGGTELNKTSGLYDLAFRNYDPALGRMYGIDPMAGKYSSLSPYNYSFNDPVSLNDPSGADPSDYFDGAEAMYEEYTGMQYMASSGQWVQDDKVMYQITGWRTPPARYAGTLALASNFYRDGNPYGGGGMDKYWKPGDGRLYWGASEEYSRELRGAADAVGYGDISAEQYGQAYGYSTSVQAVMLSMVRDLGTANYGYYVEERMRQIQATSGTMLADAGPGDPKPKKKEYDGHSLSLSGSLAFGGGVNVSLGVVWNKGGDWRFFVSGGPSAGFDASIGVAIKSITNANPTKPFDPNQYGGWGGSHNIGIGAWDIVPIGGDNYPAHFTGTPGATYNESGGGVSIIGLPLGYTYQMSKTLFPGDW